VKVNLGGEITANGKSIPMGLSNVHIDAYTMNAYNASSLNRNLDLHSYDVGIIGMTIQAHSERIETVNGIYVTQLTLIEQITEMNGEEVTQNTAMQQVFEISATQVTAHEPCEGMMSKEMARETKKQRAYHHHHRGYRMARKAGFWFKTQATFVRVFISLLVGTLLGLVFVSVFTVTSRIVVYALGYKKVPSCAAAASSYAAASSVNYSADEKKFLPVDSEKDILPTR
jgi:hypothetical protein